MSAYWTKKELREFNLRARKIATVESIARRVVNFPGETAEEKVTFWNDTTDGSDWEYGDQMEEEFYKILIQFVAVLIVDPL